MRHVWRPNSITESVASSNNLPSMWGSKFIDEAKELYFAAPKDEIVLGATDPEFSTEPVTIKYDGRSFTSLIVGSKGSGKTNMSSLLVDQLYWRFELPTFIGDPKNEYFTASMPNSIVEMRQRLKTYGLVPKSLPVFVTTPKFSADEESPETAGYTYTIDLEDFKRISKRSEREKIMKEFFKIEGSEAASNTIVRWIDDLPDKFEDWVAMLSGENKTIEGTKAKRGYASSLLNAVTSRRRGGVIGEGNKIYFPSIMQKLDGSLGEVPVLQCSIEADEVTACYLKLAIFDIIQDRIRAKKTGDGYLKSPPVIMLDELDRFCGSQENNPAKEIVEQIPLKYRMYDVFFIGATQKPQYTSPKIVAEVDYLITSKLRTAEERAILKARGMGKEDIDLIFGQLEYKRDSPAKEMAIIDPGNDFKTFFPVPAMHELFHEDAHRFTR